MNDINSNQFDVDLNNCDREPIHLLGRIQRVGFLIAVSSDWLISHVSANLGEYLQHDPLELVGTPIHELLGGDVVHTLRNRLQSLNAEGQTVVVPGLRLKDNSARFDASAHLSERRIVLEFERSVETDEVTQHVYEVQEAINRVGRLDDIDRILHFACRFSAAYTGFDRVMAYKFRPNGTGDVVAETAKSGLESFLKLRFPASDIPKQARALYIRNPIRFINDSHHEGVDILPVPRAGSTPIDLSGAILRSVSPIHLEYLRNMGVTSSMSISIIVEGQLWGLLACHHHDVKHLPQAQRNAMLLFGQMLSMTIGSALSRRENAFIGQSSALIDSISRTNVTSDGIAEVMESNAAEAMKLFSADGMAVVSNGHTGLVGITPNKEQVRRLARFLNTQPPGEIYHSNDLVSELPDAEDFSAQSCGVLAMPISKTPRDYIMFLRQPVSKTVSWLGDPNKAVTTSESGLRLSPRKSFSAWQQEVDNQSEEWTSGEIRVAERFRMSILETVLRMADEAARERQNQSQKQELLIAELNHRVRNILGLVRGLVAQTNREGSTAEFAATLENRVQALARAHDQITNQNWAPARFSALLDTEAQAYTRNDQPRVKLEGDDFMLAPTAYSSMALVIHELLTNSMKYGALADSRGHVVVRSEWRDDGSLDLSWADVDGPPVKAPTRRGFGTTIIERSVPYELNGDARISYDFDGFKAQFWIPAFHISRAEKSSSEASTPTTTENEKGGKPFPEKILFVEDNFIISMDAEEALRDLGATDVIICPNVSAALAALEETSFDCAMLDVNLGAETSIPIADELMKRGVPFFFASGYGDKLGLPEHLSGIPILTKPYDMSGIEKAFMALT